MLATLAETPKSPEEVSQFSFANADEHRKINDAVRRVYGTYLQEFILDPIPLLDAGVFARQHQEAHNQMNLALGLSGSDLSRVDFKDEDDLSTWTETHFSEHYNAAQILGLT